MTVATADLEHLHRLSDDTGLFEHAKGAVPRRSHGYCLDDVARGLVVLARQPAPDRRGLDLVDVYLAFVEHAADRHGRFRNRLGYDRSWRDGPGTGDWWGRALWGVGAVVAGDRPAHQRESACHAFTVACQQRPSWLRPLAFAALGAGQVLTARPDHAGARAILGDFVLAVGPIGTTAWPWPEARLSYANARIPEALITAGIALDDGVAVDGGLSLLRWLVARQMVGGHLSPVPVGGAGPGDAPPGFDQQPIELAAIADAAALAHTATGDDEWRSVAGRAVAWFDGANDLGVVMHDPATGGGFDGLTPAGPNTNQGAESTIAWLIASQHRTAAAPVLTPSR